MSEKLECQELPGRKAARVALQLRAPKPLLHLRSEDGVSVRSCGGASTTIKRLQLLAVRERRRTLQGGRIPAEQYKHACRPPTDVVRIPLVRPYLRAEPLIVILIREQRTFRASQIARDRGGLGHFRATGRGEDGPRIRGRSTKKTDGEHCVS